MKHKLLIIITGIILVSLFWSGTASAGWTSGKYNSAIDFNGTSTYIDGFGAIGNIKSVSFWIKADDITDRKIMDFDGGTSYLEIDASNVIQAQGFTSPTIYVDGKVSSTLTDTNWHHIAVTTDTNVNATASFKIGKATITAVDYFFDGTLDEVRFYNYIRAADEIRLDYNAGFAAKFGGDPLSPGERVSEGLVGYWNMDEGGGSTAKDSSANGNNGTLTNGPLWTKGKKSNALKFDGVNDYVLIGNVYNGVKSVSFWLKAGNTTQNILDLNGIDYIQVSAGTIAATGAGWISPAIYVDGKASFAIDTAWHYVTITTATGINASAVNLGKFSANYFNGILDEVRVYNRALSFEEINYLYNEKKPVGQWDMDEGAGTTAHDSQGNLNIAFPATESERPAWSKP